MLAHSHAADTDWIELHNTTGLDIDISGWFLSDDDSNDTNIRKYEFQDNTVIPEYGKDRYWIPIEKIDYDDKAPWPSTADGWGDSLHREDINAYGRDYSNWRSLAPTPGS